MTETEILEKLTPIFQEEFNEDNLVLNKDMNSDDIDAWDSLGTIRLCVAIEQAFEIRFATDDITELKNISQFISAIQAKV
jgi:acyl carrier protein